MSICKFVSTNLRCKKAGNSAIMQNHRKKFTSSPLPTNAPFPSQKETFPIFFPSKKEIFQKSFLIKRKLFPNSFLSKRKVIIFAL